MRKTLLALATSSVLAVSAVAAPTPANAHAWWIIPAIVGGALVTGAAINSAATANPYYYDPYGYRPRADYYGPAPAYYSGGTVAVRSCRLIRERTYDGWRQVRVCD